jgi:hypothetical protein
MCNVRNFAITSTNQTVTNINGETESFLHNQTIRALRIDSLTVEYFPKGLARIFPHLHGIRLTNSKLKLITKDDLKPFPGLRVLYLYKNLLETLDDDVFKHNPQIFRISFHGNKLKVIGENVLMSLKKLNNADFSNNICIDKNAENESEILQLIIDLESKCKGPNSKTNMLEAKVKSLEAKVKILQDENTKLKEEYDATIVKLSSLETEHEELKKKTKN